MSTAFHPQTDGQTERANRTLLEMLRSFVNPRQDNWDKCLPILEFAFNNSENPSTGFTPFFLNYGRDPGTALSRSVAKKTVYPAVAEWLKELEKARTDAIGSIKRSQKIQSAALSRKRVEKQFAVGDKVLLDTINMSIPAAMARKLSARFVGPFSVVKVINKKAYKLDLPKSFGRMHPVFNISLMKSYVPDEFSKEDRPLPVIVDGHEECFVDQILNESKGVRKRYLVLWQGFPPEEARWVSKARVDECEALDVWEARKKSKSISHTP